ncbi:MAG: cytochrome P450 [Pseudomonadota bacterium]
MTTDALAPQDGDAETPSPARLEDPTPGARITPPRPRSERSRASALRKLLVGRGNILAAMNERMHRGWMGRSNLLVHRTFLINQPDLVRRVFVERPDDFPKHILYLRALGSLLGRSLFVVNGAEWRRQRRMIDPAFAGGRLREAFPEMRDAAETLVARLKDGADGELIEIDAEMSRFAADVIFRTLFSRPIDDAAAGRVFEALARFQAAAPFASVRNLVGAPSWWRRAFPSKADRAGAEIQELLRPLVAEQRRAVEAGAAPANLCAALVAADDPETGERFSDQELVEQIALFFLAGHETSASALSWAAYLIARDRPVQERMRAEAAAAYGNRAPEFGDLRALPFTRDVLRETLRLYPPVPFVARQALKTERFRDDRVSPGSSVLVSAWFLQRHERIWDDPHVFDPDRWRREDGKAQAREAYIPFTTGARACVGAGFAMQEGVLALTALVSRFRIEADPDVEPEPVAQVTLRAKNGIQVRLTPAG